MPRYFTPRQPDPGLDVHFQDPGSATRLAPDGLDADMKHFPSFATPPASGYTVLEYVNYQFTNRVLLSSINRIRRLSNE